MLIRSMKNYHDEEFTGDAVAVTNNFPAEFSGEVICHKKFVETDECGLFDLDIYHHACITKVIYNNPAVIVFWNDDTKTIAKCHNENFDAEKGLMVATLKKIMGKDDFRTFLTDWTCEEENVVLLKDVRKKHK